MAKQQLSAWRTAIVLLLAMRSCLGQVEEFDEVAHEEETPSAKAHLVLDPSSAGQSHSSSRAADEPTPVLFWHGMGDTAFGSINVERLALQRKYPGMKVFSVQIGSNAFEDELASYFANMNLQVAQICQQMLANEAIKAHGQFNAVGYSQGGQFIRALIQRCPFEEHNIKVKNFVSLGGQHQGVYGLPNCPTALICDHVRELLSYGAYEKHVQESLVQAEYWHDPLDEDGYRRKNIFLSDLNNELHINATYKSRLLALDNLVLVQFDHDDMVVPRESSHFGFFSAGQTKEIEPLKESRLYKEDRLGLRELDQTGRLKLIRVPGAHLEFKMSWFMDRIASVYLSG